MTQPVSQDRHVLASNTEVGSGARHGIITLVVGQLLGRGLVHYGIPATTGQVVEGAEYLIDLASGGAAILAAGLGSLWRTYIVRSGAPAQSK